MKPKPPDELKLEIARLVRENRILQARLDVALGRIAELEEKLHAKLA
jgi:hypothetical protein